MLERPLLSSDAPKISAEGEIRHSSFRRSFIGLASLLATTAGIFVFVKGGKGSASASQQQIRLAAAGASAVEAQVAEALLARRNGGDSRAVDSAGNFLGLPSIIPNPLDVILKYKRDERSTVEAHYPGPRNVPPELRIPAGVQPKGTAAPATCSDAASFPPRKHDIKNGTYPAWTDSADLGCATWQANNCEGGEFGVLFGVNFNTACCACGGGVYGANENWQKRLKDPFTMYIDTRLDTGLVEGAGIGEKGVAFTNLQDAQSRCLSDIACGGFTLSPIDEEGEAEVYFSRSLQWKRQYPGLGWTTHWKRPADVVVRCDDSCTSDVMSPTGRFGYIKDGVCEDGGPGAVSSKCGYGTDCSDCHMRAYYPDAKPDLRWHQGVSYLWSDLVCSDSTVRRISGCVNFIGKDGHPFTDPKANSCAYYQGQDRCHTETAYAKSQGMSATEACCACGGGTRSSSTAPTVHSWTDSKLNRCDWYCEQPQARCAVNQTANGLNGASACCCCGGGVINMRGTYELTPEEPPSGPWYTDGSHLFGLPGVFGFVFFAVCMGIVSAKERWKEGR